MPRPHIRHRKWPRSRTMGRKGISTQARLLLRMSVRRAGSLRKAAALLHLPSHAQIPAMLEGRIGETPAMRAALLRAEARARQAFYLEPTVASLDVEEIRKLVKDLKWDVEVLEHML